MKILSSEMAQHYQVNSLQRGWLVFTSFISFNGKILFLEAHIDRLAKGADFLFPNYGWLQNKEKIKQYVESFLISSNNEYFRLNIFEDCIYLQKRNHEVSDDSLKLMNALKIKTPGPVPCYVKLSNYIEADLEIVRAKFKNYNDVLFFDHLQNMTEASTSNVFVVSESGLVLSPAPASNVLEGITRNKLIEKLKENGISVIESAVTKLDLQKSREIWLTNSIKGIRFVDQYEEKVFNKENSLFLKALNLFGRYGELV